MQLDLKVSKSLLRNVSFYLFSTLRQNRPMRAFLKVIMTMTTIGCLGGAVEGRRTRDRKVAGSTPGRGVIKSTRSIQPSIPPG